MKTYIDGILVGEATSFSGSLRTDEPDFWVGREGNADSYLLGQMDEVALWSDVRTQAEISASYRNKRLKGNEGGLVIVYHFDEGLDNTCSGGTNDVCDATTNANDGAKTNMEETDYVTAEKAVMDNNAQYLTLGPDSSVSHDRGMEIYIDSTTTFKYKWQGDQTWTTPATATLSSYDSTDGTWDQIGSTGVYVSFDTTNGVFGDESFFTIPSWAIEQFSLGVSPLSSAARGKRRAFPEKAYLVATDSTVEVLDARDNTLWMRFEQSGADTSGALGEDDNNDLSSVFMKHGQLLVGTNGSSATGMYRMDFNSDSIYRYDTTDRKTSGEVIAKRNTSDHTYGSADTNFAIVDSTVNDVHASVVEGKLYFVTATDTGLDVIQNSQTNTYSYSEATSDDYNAVWMTSGGELYGLNETKAQAEKWNNVDDDSADELNGTPDKLWDESSTPALTSAAPTIQASAPSALSVTEVTSLVDGISDSIYVGTDKGTSLIHDKAGDETNGSVKYYTKDYVTEELIGDVKGFWPLNETSTGAAAVTRSDQSKGTNNLTDNNTVPSVSGVRGQAGQFTAANSENLSISDNAALSTGDIDFTFGAWIYLDSTSAHQHVAAKFTDAPNREWELWQDTSTDKMQFRIRDGDNPIGTINSDTFGALTTGQWYFVVAWHNASGNTVNISINGGTADSAATSGTMVDTSAAFRIGSRESAASFWDGRIDEVFFMKDIPSTAQITALYTNGLEALNNKNRSQLTASQKDLLSELAGSDDTVKAVAVAKSNQTGVTRADQLFFGTNGAAADDGKLSQFIATGDIRNHTFDETSTDPYIITDNDISSLSVSSDGSYIIVGTDDSGITIIHEGAVTGRLRGGKHTQSGFLRPHN